MAMASREEAHIAEYNYLLKKIDELLCVPAVASLPLSPLMKEGGVEAGRRKIDEAEEEEGLKTEKTAKQFDEIISEGSEFDRD